MLQSKSNLTFTVFLLVATLAGCGDGGGGDPVPLGSSVRINQAAIEWEIGATPTPCPVNLNNYNDHTIAISVLDSNNSPLGSVDIRVMADLSGNTYSGTDVIKIYDDLNGNGVVDDPAELVSSNTSPAFLTQTGRYTGTKIVLVRVNLSCPYRGNLYAFAGAAFGSINIEVKNR